MENKRAKGTLYEDMAARYLQEQGYEILARNYRCRQGEIDMIVTKAGYLVFVEVKYRATGGSGGPLEAVDHRKQYRISRVADYYCMSHGLNQDQPCRFDVVAILDRKICHMENAFDYC